VSKVVVRISAGARKAILGIMQQSKELIFLSSFYKLLEIIIRVVNSELYI
jgi:hypothetical protein